MDSTLRTAEGVYVTLNPVCFDVHARAYNRLKPYVSYATGDAEVLRRVWLPIDCDPSRPAGVSATATEREVALQRRDVVVDELKGADGQYQRCAATGTAGTPSLRAISRNTPDITCFLSPRDDSDRRAL